MPRWASSNRPIALAVGPGERPLLVAEQLALQQVLVAGRPQLTGDERARPVGRRRLVDGPGDLLLAGAGLAADQDGRGRVGDLADELEDVVHLRALAQHVLERVPALELAAQGGHLVLEGPRLAAPA